VITCQESFLIGLWVSVSRSHERMLEAETGVINSIGNLGGFAGPYAIGWIKDATGDITLGLVVLAAGPIMAGLIVILMGHDSKMEMAGSRVMAE
jgi:nitrate/nitrite transporter NarK